MGRMVHGTNGLHVVRIVRTNSQWYEKSKVFGLWYNTTRARFRRVIAILKELGIFGTMKSDNITNNNLSCFG